MCSCVFSSFCYHQPYGRSTEDIYLTISRGIVVSKGRSWWALIPPLPLPPWGAPLTPPTIHHTLHAVWVTPAALLACEWKLMKAAAGELHVHAAESSCWFKLPVVFRWTFFSLVLSDLCWSSLLRRHHTKGPNEPTYCERAVEHHSRLQLYFHHLLLLTNERSSWHRLFHAFLETGNNSTSMKAGFHSNMPNIMRWCETCSTVRHMWC